jgi:predicted nucleotidyltransferase
MLKIINNLQPFFEDCYRRISVREYGKLISVSPPTASKLLKKYKKEGLLHQTKEYHHLLFNLNNENAIDLCRIYWRNRLESLTKELKDTYAAPTIILFGSASKAELKQDSDIDIALITPKKTKIDITAHSKKLQREINLHTFHSLQKIKNIYLRNNIINGYTLAGTLRWE